MKRKHQARYDLKDIRKKIEFETECDGEVYRMNATGYHHKLNAKITNYLYFINLLKVTIKEGLYFEP